MTLKEKKNSVTESNFVFILLLFSSLLVLIRLPFLKYAVYDYLLPLSAFTLLALNFNKLKDAVTYHRKTLLFLLMLYVWMWISALFSDYQSTAIKYSIKYTIYLIVFFSFLVITYKKQGEFIYLRLVLRFLTFLALLGMIEYFYPELWIFHFIRSTASLMVKPRISSLMQWPNQLGVLMSLGIVLSLISYKKKSISSIEFYTSSFLFIFTLSLASSRNGWLVFFIGIFLAWLYRVIKLKNAILIVGILSFSILFFPVSTTQLGIRENNFFPVQNIINNLISGPQFLLNGDFEKGNTSSWEFWVYPEIGASATFSVNVAGPHKGSYNGIVIITSTGPSQSDMQLKQGNFQIEKGEDYKVSFAARAAEPKFIRVVVIKNAPYWRLYGLSKEVELSTSWQVFEYTFTATEDATDASLNFYFGTGAVDVEIDSIRFTYSDDGFNSKEYDSESGLPKDGTDREYSFLEKATRNLHYNRWKSNAGKKNLSFYGVTPAQTMHSRTKLWEIAKNEFFKNPITGVGIQSFNSLVGKEVLADAGESTHNSHNLFINLLVELGIPGFLLAFVFVFNLVKRSDFSNPLVCIPLILLFAGQIFDFFLYDFTYTIITLYFLAEAGNSIRHANN